MPASVPASVPALMSALVPALMPALVPALALVVFQLTPCFAQPAAQASARSAWALQLDPFMQALVHEHRYLGGMALVLHQGRVVWQRAVGHQDMAREQVMREDALFRIYSMSKPIVSVAALQLVAQGRLQLDDPVAHHLPGFARLQVWAGSADHLPLLRAPSRALTVRHLLTHTSGFATGGAGIEAPSALLQAAQLEQSAHLQDYAERVARVPLAADPGQRFRYDGVNTEVLGRVLEVVAGQPLHDILQQRLFVPLGMIDTGFEVALAQRHRLVVLTRLARPGKLQAEPERSGARAGLPLRPYDSGAGGLYATAQDYGRFCQMLLNGGTLHDLQVLPRAWVDTLMQSQLEQTDPPPGLPPDQFRPGDGFGLGGAVVLEPAASASGLPAGSFGWTGAASTYFSLHRPSQLCAVFMLQHLPQEDAAELPKLQHRFFQRVHLALRSTTARPAARPATQSAEPR